MKPIDKVLAAYPDAKREGDSWRARCPIHEDAHPSLRISEGRDGTVLLKCRVCGKNRTKDILAAVGLTFADLFQKRDRINPSNGKIQKNGKFQAGELVAIYVYEDEHRQPIAEKHRLEWPGGRKEFLQRLYGATEWGLNGTKLPLYMVADIREAPTHWPIAICEGEKDADAMRTLGLVATTNAEGASTWEPRHSEPLRGRQVYILEDNDDAGRQRSQILTKALAGIATEVKVIALPNLPEKGDVFDWLEAGHTRDELIEIVRATPAVDHVQHSDHVEDESAADLCASEPENTPWLVPGYIAEAAVTELDGKVKLGKTSLALDAVRALMRGGLFLGSACQPTSVVYITEQGRPSFTKALRRASLDQARGLYPIFWLEHRHRTWPDLIQYAVAKCQRRGAKLLVVDTISKLAGIKQENEAGDMAAAVEPLQVHANGAGIAVLALRHDRKSGGEVGDSGRGNSQMTGDADIVVQLTRPEGNHPRTRRLLNRISRFDDETSVLIERQEDNTFVELGEPGDYAKKQTKAAILEAVPEHAEIATPALAGELNGRDEKDEPKALTGQQRDALKELVADGELIQEGEGKRGSPHRYRRGSKLGAPYSHEFRQETASTTTTQVSRAQEGVPTVNTFVPKPTPLGRHETDPLVGAALVQFPGSSVKPASAS